MSVDFRPGAGQGPRTSQDLPPATGSGVPADAKVSDPLPRNPVHTDGVDAARPAADGQAEAASPRKAAQSKLGTLTRRVLKGAAAVGMAAALIVGGLFMTGKVQDHQAPTNPVQIEAPHELQDPALPGGQGPPNVEIEAPGQNTGAPGTEGRGPTLPSAPNAGGEAETTPNGTNGTLPQLERDDLQRDTIQPRTFSPLTIRTLE